MTESWVRRALDLKRGGGEIPGATWERLIDAFVAGTIDEAPIAALLMASAIRGLSAAETQALTEAMIRSGDRIAFDGTVVDKHSTGGVGDSVSMIVVPVVAACGVPVAKLSGHALGHTGGTLDKLESIPGVRTTLTPAEFRAQVERIGCAISAQSKRLVPADQRLYDLRDRTGTVNSIGLIAASIVSKKIAGGATAIVFDVKTGGGAFMATLERANELARAMVEISAGLGRRASALITDMDEPLGPSIGDALEVIEARAFLTGSARDPRLAEVVRLIAAEMLRVGGAPGDPEALIDAALTSGHAYEKFVALIEAQGGSRTSFEAMHVPNERIPVRAHARRPRDVGGRDRTRRAGPRSDRRARFERRNHRACPRRGRRTGRRRAGRVGRCGRRRRGHRRRLHRRGPCRAAPSAAPRHRAGCRSRGPGESWRDDWEMDRAHDRDRRCRLDRERAGVGAQPPRG